MTISQLQGKEYVSDDSSEKLSDKSLHEFWTVEGKELEEYKKEIKDKGKEVLFNEDGQQEIDKKLEEYLSIHSMNLSKNIREYVEKSKSGKLRDEEAISSLGLMAWERKKFLKSVKNLEDKF